MHRLNTIAYLLLVTLSTLADSKPLKELDSPMCSTQASDIYFVLDSSFSISVNDYQLQMVFVKALLDKFVLGENHIRIGLISFSSEVRMDIPLNKFSTIRDLKNGINKIRQMRKGTQTQEALRFLHQSAFSENHGGRPWAKKQVVLITDGFPEQPEDTLRQAAEARRKGIELFSIGVGGWDLAPGVRGLASEPKETHSYLVDSYSSLGSLSAALMEATCHVMGQADQPQDPGEMARFRCSVTAADVIFVLDASSSIWDKDFDLQRDFVNQTVSKFDLGPLAIRVGVVIYSDAPLTLHALDDPQSLEHVRKALTEAPHVTGGTDTSFAIDHVRRNAFQPSHQRPHVAKVMILLTDGESKDFAKTKIASLRARSEGIKIFAIGIGEESKSEALMTIASKPSDQFILHVKDCHDLVSINDLLAIKACDVAGDVMMSRVTSSCTRSPRDTVFIYDTKTLSPRHRKHVIGIIAEVTSAKGLDSEALRFGVLREAREPSSVQDIELTNEWTQSTFINELENDSQKHASVHLLLRKARRKYFTPTIQYDFIVRKRTVVIFLDSPLQKGFNAMIEAKRLKNSEVDIIVVTLGHHFHQSQADMLVSEPKNMYTISTPGHFHQRHTSLVANRLLSVLCS